ncbi:MAG: nucleoside recognition domain-containing protein [Oscillospiraceae bacterium]
MEERQRIPPKQLIKFLLVSLIGVLAFMLPFTYEGSINTTVGVLTIWVKKLLSGAMDEIIFGLVAVSAIGSLIDYILTKTGKPPKGRFHTIFNTTIVYVITKLLALAIVVMCYFGIGPQIIISSDVGGTMIDLGKTLVALAFALSYLLPFLTEGGLMEFGGEITRPFVRPMFKVPSDASIDLIASWLGASNAAVILSAEKYKKGYYTKKEAAIVMCNFSLVSIPFCLVIASTAGVGEYFPAMYGLLCALGVILAVIMPRIYPLSKLKDEFYCKLERDESNGKGEHMLRRAVLRSIVATKEFTVKKVLGSGTNVMISICVNLLPTVIGWGVLGLLLVQHTPILEWISLPMGWLLNLMGVEQAFAVAPATLAGFVDMFIPALLITGVTSVRTRFIIATLSLIQIIYITEVGAVIIQTDLGVDFKKLFLIFLERTLISLPIIVLFSLLIF